MYTYQTFIDRYDQMVPRAMAHFITDKSSPNYAAAIGGPSDMLEFSWHFTKVLGFAFITPQSRYYGNAEIGEILEAHIAYGYSDLTSRNLLSLKTTNWGSAPDTAFAVDALAPLLFFCREKRNTCQYAARIDDVLSPFIEKISTAIIDNGFHTPNHRWEIAGTLAMAKKLFPNLPADNYIESLLAEGVDINADGEYTERSTGVYNAVCDRGFLLVALFMNRHEYLEPVRKNVTMMNPLFHDDGSVVTLFSSRQDQGKKMVPVTLAPVYFLMGHVDGNAQLKGHASYIMANSNRETSPTDFSFLLSDMPFLCFPELRDETPPAIKFENNFEQLFPASKLWRKRTGEMSATIGAKHERFFSLKFGQAELKCIKIAAPFHGRTIFNADSIESIPNGIRLIDECTRNNAGYYLPLGRPVTTESFAEDQTKREKIPSAFIAMTVDIEQIKNGFDITLMPNGGPEGLPAQFELAFNGPGIWETDNSSVDVTNSQTALLLGDSGTFRVKEDAIRITGGTKIHQMREMRGSDPESGFRVIVPVSFGEPSKIRLEYGKWSPATRKISTFNA